MLFSIAQLFPSQYAVFASGVSTANGSSATGNCADVSSCTSETLTCADPTSSVLFDDPRGMPILTGLEGDMWASQLLTIQTTASHIEMIFDFQDIMNFVRVERVEVVMFNCLQWGIEVQTIQALDQGQVIATVNLDITSCESLVRVCLPASTTVPVITLRFSLSPGSDWVHLAEVSFWGNGRICPPDDVIGTPTIQPEPSKSFNP